MTRTLVATPDFPAPNGTWKRDLPVWAVLELDWWHGAGWRSRYLGVGAALAHRRVLAVHLTGADAPVLVRKG